MNPYSQYSNLMQLGGQSGLVGANNFGPGSPVGPRPIAWNPTAGGFGGSVQPQPWGGGIGTQPGGFGFGGTVHPEPMPTQSPIFGTQPGSGFGGTVNPQPMPNPPSFGGIPGGLGGGTVNPQPPRFGGWGAPGGGLQSFGGLPTYGQPQQPQPGGFGGNNLNNLMMLQQMGRM